MFSVSCIFVLPLKYWFFKKSALWTVIHFYTHHPATSATVLLFLKILHQTKLKKTPPQKKKGNVITVLGPKIPS